MSEMPIFFLKNTLDPHPPSQRKPRRLEFVSLEGTAASRGQHGGWTGQIKLVVRVDVRAVGGGVVHRGDGDVPVRHYQDPAPNLRRTWERGSARPCPDNGGDR